MKFLKSFIVIAVLLFVSKSAHAEIPSETAIRAIMGEARGEFGMNKEKKLQAMVAIAEAIRNRAKLKYYKNRPFHGVYGVNAKGIDKEKKWVWDIAKKAWEQSENSNSVKGAQYWGTKEDIAKFKKEKWFQNVTKVVTIGGHTYYKIK